MKRRIVRSLGILAIVTVAIVSIVAIKTSRPHVINIMVEAPIGTKLTGSYQIDGVFSHIDTEAPASFEVTGRLVEFSIKKDSQPGQMTVTLNAAGSGQAQITAGPGDTVHCGFRQEGGLLGSTNVWANKVVAGTD